LGGIIWILPSHRFSVGFKSTWRREAWSLSPQILPGPHQGTNPDPPDQLGL
jgi:hypothetical protein